MHDVLPCPFGVQRPGSCTTRPEARKGRVYGWDGVSKVSFNILQTWWVYKICIYLVVYLYWKIITNIFMGFKIWCQAEGGRTPFSKLSYSHEFSNIWFQTCLFFLNSSVFLKIFNLFVVLNWKNSKLPWWGGFSFLGLKSRFVDAPSGSSAGFTQRDAKRRFYGYQGMGQV